jgi:hypothetical protein
MQESSRDHLAITPPLSIHNTLHAIQHQTYQDRSLQTNHSQFSDRAGTCCLHAVPSKTTPSLLSAYIQLPLPASRRTTITSNRMLHSNTLAQSCSSSATSAPPPPLPPTPPPPPTSPTPGPHKLLQTTTSSSPSQSPHTPRPTLHYSLLVFPCRSLSSSTLRSTSHHSNRKHSQTLGEKWSGTEARPPVRPLLRQRASLSERAARRTECASSASLCARVRARGGDGEGEQRACRPNWLWRGGLLGALPYSLALCPFSLSASARNCYPPNQTRS